MANANMSVQLNWVPPCMAMFGLCRHHALSSLPMIIADTASRDAYASSGCHAPAPACKACVVAPQPRPTKHLFTIRLRFARTFCACGRCGLWLERAHTLCELWGTMESYRLPKGLLSDITSSLQTRIGEKLSELLGGVDDVVTVNARPVLLPRSVAGL